jgi:hypothetical protein
LLFVLFGLVSVRTVWRQQSHLPAWGIRALVAYRGPRDLTAEGPLGLSRVLSKMFLKVSCGVTLTGMEVFQGFSEVKGDHLQAHGSSVSPERETD